MATVVTTKVRQGDIEINLQESYLIVHYDVEKVRVYADNPNAVLEIIDSRPVTKNIKIGSLTTKKESEMAQIAADIVEKCEKYIHSSRVEEVEQLRLVTTR